MQIWTRLNVPIPPRVRPCLPCLFSLVFVRTEISPTHRTNLLVPVSPLRLVRRRPRSQGTMSASYRSPCLW